MEDVSISYYDSMALVTGLVYSKFQKTDEILERRYRVYEYLGL